jgi:hypothetical protein
MKTQKTNGTKKTSKTKTIVELGTKQLATAAGGNGGGTLSGLSLNHNQTLVRRSRSRRGRA